MREELEALAGKWKAVWGGRHEHECAEDLRAVLARWDDSAQRRGDFVAGAKWAWVVESYPWEEAEQEAARRYPAKALVAEEPSTTGPEVLAYLKGKDDTREAILLELEGWKDTPGNIAIEDAKRGLRGQPLSGGVVAWRDIVKVLRGEK